MDVLWIVLGVALLLITLLDTFLAVLNYDEAGLFVNRFVRWHWLILRAITRRVGRRWRPVVLRQVTGILLVLTILWWVTGIVLGFAFIYLGAMGIGAFQVSSGVTPNLLGAFYLSLGQFSTVGVDHIDPGTAILNLLTVSEALISVILLSFIITFLGGVYGTIQSLRAFSANFFRAGRGVGDPIDTLEPFFPDGQARGLDGQLNSILDALNTYSDGVAQNRSAYYFQSGRDQFSLPFSLSMTAGVIAGLRWGLPTGSDPAKEPGLIRLTEAYDDFRLRMQRALGWASGPTPRPVAADRFAGAVSVFEGPEANVGLDPWVLRFLAMDRRMAALTQSATTIDVDDAYRRYCAWLPFGFESQSFVASVSRDLDYQPIYRGVATTPDGIPLDGDGDGDGDGVGDGDGDGDGDQYGDGDGSTSATGAVDPLRRLATATARPRRRAGARAWLRRRYLFIDPGAVRLAYALRTLLAVGAAIGVVVPLALAAGAEPVGAGVFAGLVALFSAPMTVSGSIHAGRWAAAAATVPAAIGVIGAVLLPRDPVWTIVALAVVAALAAWVRRFGVRVGGLGQLAFLTYYYTLVLGIDASQLLGALIVAAVGLACTWIANLIPGPSARRQIRGGTAAVFERVLLLLDTMADLVASGRPDRRLVRMLRAEQAALERTTNSLSGQLDEENLPGVSAERARALRLRVFGVQLSAENLASLLPVTSSIAITMDERARLTADLLAVRRRIESFRSEDAARFEHPEQLARLDPAGAPDEWPTDARRILGALSDLHSSIDRLHRAEDEDDHVLAAEQGHEQDQQAREVQDVQDVSANSVGAETGAAKAARDARASAADRQSVQAGLSTGLALFLGSLVSTSHQLWAAMPAFQVLSGSDGETRFRGVQRIVATILGSGVAFGLAILANHSPAVAFPLLIVSVFFMSFLRAVSSTWTAFWQMLILATMYDMLGTLDVETVQVRVVETTIGAVVAMLVAAFVLPTRTRARVLLGMSDAVRRAGALAEGLFARAAGRAGPTPTAMGADGRDLVRRLDALESIARPMRRNPGSLQSTGIEAQLTSLWSLLYFEQRIARQLQRLEVASLSSDEWIRIAQATAENFAAARAVLAGDLPLRVHAASDFDLDLRPGVSADERELAVFVERLNQALLSLIEAITPGTVGAMTDSSAVAAGGRVPTGHHNTSSDFSSKHPENA